MATAAFALLLLLALTALGRPPGPLTARAVPSAALRGAVALSRLSEARRDRLQPPALPATGRDTPPAQRRVPAGC
jgi:hypothetical protein